MTNSTSNYILKSFNSAYFKERAPNNGAVCALRFLNFILEFGESFPADGA
jgi:hypothetical protein